MMRQAISASHTFRTLVKARRPCLQENQGLDFQAFFDLLQRLAEERGLMGELVVLHMSMWSKTHAIDDIISASNEIMDAFSSRASLATLLQTQKTPHLTIGCRWKPCETWQHRLRMACVLPWGSYVARALQRIQIATTRNTAS
jgi:hypothetical protein